MNKIGRVVGGSVLVFVLYLLVLVLVDDSEPHSSKSIPTSGSLGFVHEKALRSCLGSFVADGASMGTEWIYNHKTLFKLLESNPKYKGNEGILHPEFFQPPSSPFFNHVQFPGHYSPGSLSPYGEEALALLDYLYENQGEFISGGDWAKSLYDWALSYTGRKNHPTTDFEQKYQQGKRYPECGAFDAQANAFWKVPLITARYFHDLDVLEEKLESAIRAHQNHPQSVAFGLTFGRMLAFVLNHPHPTLEQALEVGKINSPDDVIRAIQRGWDERTIEIDPFGEELEEFFVRYERENHSAKSCGFPQSLLVSVKILGDSLVVKESQRFQYGVRRNILAGGDSCGRSALIGAMLAALYGPTPESWNYQLLTYNQLEAKLSRVMKQ